MSFFSDIVFIILAIITAFVFAYFLCKWYFMYKSKQEQRLKRKNAVGINSDSSLNNFLCDGLARKILNYVCKVSYSLSILGVNKSLTKNFIKNKNLNKRLNKISLKANMPSFFNNLAYRESQFRISIFFGIIGALVGVLFSFYLMFILLFCGLIFGSASVAWSMKKEALKRTLNLEKYLPEMLEVLCLGLRSGLSFDRALKIYTNHFKNNFSSDFCIAQDKWENGICSREDSLRQIARTYDSVLFERLIESIIRSLNFGSSLVESLEDAVVNSRNNYKAKQEEIVSKIPVKMMIPTGTLILPAMLIFVLGPVLLELINGF